MKNEKSYLWHYKGNENVLGFKAVRNEILRRTSLIGEHGEIYSRGKHTLWLRCWTPIIANKHLKSHLKIYGHPEGTVYIENDELGKWVKRLHIFPTQELQTEYANKHMNWNRYIPRSNFEKRI